MNAKFLIIISFLLSKQLFSQKDRYQFAVSYFGLETEYIPETNSYYYINNEGTITEQELSSSLTPRILIGGTHFWGHADFYLSIPTINFNLDSDSKASISNGVLTGFRFLPLKLKSKRVSPYFGLGFNAKQYVQQGQNGDGAKYTNWQLYPEAGFTYVFKGNNLIDFGARYFNHNSFNSFIDRSTMKTTEVSPISLSFSYKKAFDFTKGYSSDRSKKYMKKIYEVAEKNNAFNSISFGLGMSALIPLNKTELASRKVFLNDEIEGGVNIDLGIAYYIDKYKTSFRLSFRPLKQEEEAHAYQFRLKRNSLALEAFHFFADYHGFVPFIGPYISVDQYHLNERDFNQTIIDETNYKLGYGIVFGWDIKQTNFDFLTLRTNLRYTPQLNHNFDNYKFTTQQIEFNFIQIVFYPERFKIYKKTTL